MKSVIHMHVYSSVQSFRENFNMLDVSVDEQRYYSCNCFFEMEYKKIYC